MYKELPEKIVEEALLEMQNKNKDKNHFVAYIFGTVEQVNKTLSEFDKEIIRSCQNWKTK